MKPRGQVLVELAVALPLLLFVILGAIEAGFLVVDKARQDRATATVAEWAATHPGESWNRTANYALPGCVVSVSEPRPDLAEATSRCQYSPHVFGMWSGLPMTSRETAAGHRKGDDTEPDATPSSSSTT